MTRRWWLRVFFVSVTAALTLGALTIVAHALDPGTAIVVAACVAAIGQIVCKLIEKKKEKPTS